MLGFKGVGFVAALIYNFFTTWRTLREWVLRYAWPYLPCLAKRPEDKFADAVARVMVQVNSVPYKELSYIRGQTC